MVNEFGPVGMINAENYRRILQQNDLKLLEETARLDMLLDLQKKGLFTRDILAFGVGQAKRRTFEKKPHHWLVVWIQCTLIKEITLI